MILINKHKRRQQGMTLLEVVVAMLVIGLGMTASIAMLQASMRNNVAALNRNNALYLSEAIIDKMRMNKFAVRQYLYGAAGGAAIDTDFSLKSEEGSACKFCENEDQKTAFAQASRDVNIWQEELQQKLPGAGFAIYEISEVDARYGIQLRWPNSLDLNRSGESAASKEEVTDSLETVFTL